MSEEKEVTAADVIDMAIEHLRDRRFMERLIENGNTHEKDLYHASKEIDRSYTRLSTKLDNYMDERIKRMLVDSNLIKLRDPMD